MHEAHKIYYYSPILAKPTDKAFFILADSLLFRSENVERLLAKLFGSVFDSLDNIFEAGLSLCLNFDG